MKKQEKDEKDERKYLCVIGPTEAAHIMGWKNRSSFYKYFNYNYGCDKYGYNKPHSKIRFVRLTKGVYYLLEDVFKEAYPVANESELRELIMDYMKERRTKIKKVFVF